MTMSVVYVREQGAVIRKTGELLRVTHQGKELFTIPLANLEQLILMGNVQITTPAATLLMGAQVDVVFLSQYGKYRGRLMLLGSRFAQLRHLQLRMVDDEARVVGIARQIVTGKVNNQRVILQRRAGEDPAVRRAFDGMLAMQRRAEGADDIERMRGYEGKAAAYYFDALRHLFPVEWGFQGRAYHPPPDPANSLLSLTYTLLLKDVEAKLQLVGLDPYLGFFHALGYDRPALALDIMEEFRPSIADLVVLNMVRGGQIALHDFEWTGVKELPVRMKKEAMHALVTAYEARMADRVYHPLQGGQVDYRYAIELQVRQMARLIKGEAAEYTPLTMK